MAGMARRTLARPPSQRDASSGGEVPGSRLAGAEGAADEEGKPTWQPEIAGGLASLVTTVVLVLLGGVLGLTTGLVFVAGVGGAITGLLLAGSPRPRPRLRVVAVGLAVAAVLVGAVGGWLIAVGQGGTLALGDYLWALTGLLVPVEIVMAALAAAWGVAAGPIRS